MNKDMANRRDTTGVTINVMIIVDDDKRRIVPVVIDAGSLVRDGTVDIDRVNAIAKNMTYNRLRQHYFSRKT